MIMGSFSLIIFILIAVAVWKLSRKAGKGANHLFFAFLALFVFQSPSLAFIFVLLFFNKKKGFSIRENIKKKIMTSIKKKVDDVKKFVN